MNKLALVTGGTRGIGEAISVSLRNKGYAVVANYAGNEKVAQEFSEKHDIPAIRFDVSSYEATQKGIEDIESDMGPISILVNNAGITRDKSLHKMPYESWHSVIQTNLNASFNTCHAVIKSMRAQKFGRIINISSINGLAGQYGQTNYSAAKAGLIGFTKSLSLECAAYGITVNVVAPGYISTDMLKSVPADILEKIIAKIPVGRLGSAEEVAKAVLFLCDDSSGFITGSTLSINGGQYMQ